MATNPASAGPDATPGRNGPTSPSPAVVHFAQTVNDGA